MGSLVATLIGVLLFWWCRSPLFRAMTRGSPGARVRFASNPRLRAGARRPLISMQVADQRRVPWEGARRKAVTVERVESDDIQNGQRVDIGLRRVPNGVALCEEWTGRTVSSRGQASRNSSGSAISRSTSHPSPAARRGAIGRRDARRPGAQGARDRPADWLPPGCAQTSMPLSSDRIPNSKAPPQGKPSSLAATEARLP